MIFFARELSFVIMSFNCVGRTYGSEIENYTCYGKACFPPDYNKYESPGDHWTIYVNLYSAENAVKEIDVQSMMIKFEPIIAMAWHDPRVRVMDFGKTNITHQYLEDRTLENIWIPKITVSNHKERDKSFSDPGRFSK